MEEPKKAENGGDDKESKEDNKENDVVEVSKSEEQSKVQDQAPADDLFAKFKKKAGSWTCEVCMITNDADRTTCIACESPRPGHVAASNNATATSSGFSFGTFGASNTTSSSSSGFSFGAAPAADSQKTEDTSKSESQAPPADDLFAKFMKKAGSWTCEVCMVSNDADRTTCIACESPRPGHVATTAEAGASAETEPAKPTFQFGSSGGFKFGSGEAAKTDTKDTTSGFSFGGGNSSDNKEVTGGFKFGSTETAEPAAKDTATGFSFGVSNAAASDSSVSTGFKFGAQPETKAEETGEPTEKKPCQGIFGSLNTTESSQSSSTPVAAAGFSFGTTSTPAAKGFQFSDKMGLKVDMNASDTPKTKNKKGEYLSNLKALNNQVTTWIKSHVDTNPLIDLTPVFKDYEKHIGDLKTKFNIQASITAGKTEVKEATKALTFSTTPSPLTTTTFGSTNSTFGSGPAAGFSFGFMKSSENKPDSREKEADEGGEDPAESSSPQKPAEPVVEEDALYTKKCKLFYKKGDQYVERGLGNLHLKLTECGRLQLVVRASTSLGNILLNILVTAATPLERLGANNVMLVSVPNPPLDKKTEEQTPVTFLIRVKTGEDADELKQKISDLCKSE